MASNKNQSISLSAQSVISIAVDSMMLKREQMKLSNATLISPINGIGTIQEVGLSVSASFALSQNTEALFQDAYKPYATEYDKINAKIRR